MPCHHHQHQHQHQHQHPHHHHLPLMSIEIVTNIGTLPIKLYTDKAPLTCRNFIKLCKLQYYCWCIFHHVERDFIAQTGRPFDEEGACFEYLAHQLTNETRENQVSRWYTEPPNKGLQHCRKGLLAMTNRLGIPQNHQFGSQFYLTLTDRPLTYLDNIHLIFGEVTSLEGLQLVDKINSTIVDAEGRPKIDIYVSDIIIKEDPFPDPILPVALSTNRSSYPPNQVPPPSKTFLKEYRPDPEDPDAHLTPQERADQQMAREARRHALKLELLGERTSADLEAPDNVLFICRLHPWTEADDLQDIMTNFGQVTKCEIVRDRETGESKGYGFVEFINRKECEQAYTQLTGEDVELIIDDRRIKVDFCHSLVKVEQQRRAEEQRGNRRFEQDPKGGVRETRHKSQKDYRSRPEERYNRNRNSNRGDERDRSPSTERRRHHHDDLSFRRRHHR